VLQFASQRFSWYLGTVLLFFALIEFPAVAFSQSDFYNIRKVQEIRINFYDAHWKTTLDSLFAAGNSDIRIGADVTINGTVFHRCGVRYKGFSSWNSSETKNPFNIDLDFSIKNQNYQGYTTLKLSNGIYDPSFIREVLSYYIVRQYMPASQANFSELYINDTLIGLYTNVEAVNDEFIEKHFGSCKNTFFKGSPEALDFPFGDNANLSYIEGEDSTYYMTFYKMESEYGWSRLFELIRILNSDTASLPSVLNIDRTLWMHAFNYSLLNLDSYIAYSQNYYMYEDDNSVFNPIVWDLNMSFGSFRYSDGALNYNGVTINKLKTLNPLQHLTFSISPRPLMKNLFLNSTYRKMYLAHIRTIINRNIISDEYLQIAQELHDTIAFYVDRDTNKFYPYEYFQNNLTSTVGASGEQYPGIQDLMEARATYLSTYSGIGGYPLIDTPVCNPARPGNGSIVNITTVVEGATEVYLYYRFHPALVFSKAEMSDDGLHNDGTSDDGIYGITLTIGGETLEYYVWAENETAGAFLPEDASYKFFTANVYPVSGRLVINEYGFCGANSIEQCVNLPAWIELFNNSQVDINLKSFTLEQNDNVWYFTDTAIPANSFLCVSADAAFAESETNLGFFLSCDCLMLKSDSGEIIDSCVVICPKAGNSVGRYPNGSGDFRLLLPSMASFNIPVTLNLPVLYVSPNPASKYVIVQGEISGNQMNLKIFNQLGGLVYSKQFNSCNTFFAEKIELNGFASGEYIILLMDGTKYAFMKFIVI